MNMHLVYNYIRIAKKNRLFDTETIGGVIGEGVMSFRRKWECDDIDY